MTASDMKAACNGLRVLIDYQKIDVKEFIKNNSLHFDSIIASHKRMINGAIVNCSEQRQALHMALRSTNKSTPFFNDILRERQKIQKFADEIRSGVRLGCRGDRITDIINIGIGGSDMGPKAVYHALRSADDPVKLHFLSSVDGILLERVLSQCNPFSTLVIVSSKSFTTRETLVNAAAVEQWLNEAGIRNRDREKHIVVVTANPKAAKVMGLPQENLFRFWDWVGGRFSVWGAVGLPVAIALGSEAFTQLLAGAEAMDQLSVEAPLETNYPALLALIAFRNAKELPITSHCVLPYDERLREIFPWVQQLEMESLGKGGTSVGLRLKDRTGLPVWGASGNEGQHSFYQWLREGTDCTSIDMLVCRNPNHKYPELARVLNANASAQIEALSKREGPYFNLLTVIELDEITPRTLASIFHSAPRPAIWAYLM